jgi:hypothetical protein
MFYMDLSHREFINGGPYKVKELYFLPDEIGKNNDIYTKDRMMKKD